MIRSILIILSLFCTTINTSAQNERGVSSRIKNTTIDIDNINHDFGKIQESSGEVSHTFTIKNTGTEPLVIYTIETGCGCAVPQWEKTPLLPGKTSKITVTYDPADRPGEFEKPINVMCNVAGGYLKLSIKGNVIPRPRTIEDDFPQAITEGLRIVTKSHSIGNIPRGEISFSEIGIANNSDKPLEIDIDRRYLLEYIIVEPQKKLLVPKERSTINIKIDATTLDLWGDLNFFFPLIVNGIKQEGSIEVNATLIEDFKYLTKSQLNDAPYSEYSSYFYHFSDQPVGSKLERDFHISNAGKDDLIIRYIDYNRANLKISLDKRVIKSGETATITVEMKRTDKRGSIAETFKILTNDPEMPVRALKIMATIK